jgi:GNAT superfamily N-acetyltransferase
MNVIAVDIVVLPADEGRAFDAFIDLPYQVRGADPAWVPPLRIQQRDALDRVGNPFYRHAQIRLFIAYRDGRPAGRIAAINNAVHNQTHGERTTQWGFFECENDNGVASALFAAVEGAAADWGHDLLRGPFNPSVNDEIGLQIDAFDKPSFVMIPSNPAYYLPLVEAAGYSKTVDLYCFWIDAGTVSDDLTRIGPAIIARGDIRYRKLDKATLDRDAEKIWQVYNSAWEKNWLWVHATREEFLHLVKSLRQIADFDLAWVAETPHGEMVGISIAIPNINEAIMPIRDGRLFPLGWAHLFWGSRRGAIKGLRFLVMGVLEPWRGQGIDVALNYHQLREAVRGGYTHGEMSQILETNTPMLNAATRMGGVRYKTHRMFEKALPGTVRQGRP